MHGNSVSFTDEVGTWTISAEGEYVWRWDAVLDPRGSVNLLFGARDMSQGSVSVVPQAQEYEKGLLIATIIAPIIAIIAGSITYVLVKRRKK